jgi:hypothetical protein
MLSQECFYCKQKAARLRGAAKGPGRFPLSQLLKHLTVAIKIFNNSGSGGYVASIFVTCKDTDLF